MNKLKEAVQGAIEATTSEMNTLNECIYHGDVRGKDYHTIKFALEYLSASVEEGWKPITEAPRDLKDIVIRAGDKSYIGSVNQHGTVWIHKYDEDYNYGIRSCSNATHFKPLTPKTEQMLEDFKKGFSDE